MVTDLGEPVGWVCSFPPNLKHLHQLSNCQIKLQKTWSIDKFHQEGVSMPKLPDPIEEKYPTPLERQILDAINTIIEYLEVDVAEMKERVELLAAKTPKSKKKGK